MTVLPTHDLVQRLEGPAHLPRELGLDQATCRQLFRLQVVRGQPVGADWIVYHTADGLRRSPISGGKVETLTSTGGPDSGVLHRFPQVLPRGRGVLFTVTAGNRTADSSVAVFDAATSEVRTLLSGGGSGRYAFTGHLVYGSRQGPDRRRRRPARECPRSPAGRGRTARRRALPRGLTFYSLSDNGTLSYLPSRSGSGLRQSLSWVDRSGRSNRLPMPLDSYSSPALSPDGRSFAVSVRGEVVVIDIETGRRSQVTRGGFSVLPVWASGGESLVFGSVQGATTDCDLYRREVAGVEAAEMLAGGGGEEIPHSIHGFLGDSSTSLPTGSASSSSTRPTPRATRSWWSRTGSRS